MDPVGIRIWTIQSYNKHNVQVFNIPGVWSIVTPDLEDWSTAANIAASLSYGLRQAKIPQHSVVILQETSILEDAVEVAHDPRPEWLYQDTSSFNHDGSYYMYHDDLRDLRDLIANSTGKVKLDFGLAWAAVEALKGLLRVAEELGDTIPTPYEIRNCMHEFQDQGMQVDYESQRKVG